MKRLLLLYYSQSGDVARIAEEFALPFRDLPDVEVIVRQIEPVPPYPFPWGTLTRLLSVFPECQRGGGASIRPLGLDPGEKFDLVILAYQVWHLAPSLPIQGFFKSADAQLLRGARVITLCVCRNMWHSGSETMKRMLREAGALHLDNVVVSHQGPPFATFVSVPRLLLYGKRDGLWGIFPPAEVSRQDIERVQRLGQAASEKLRQREDWPCHSLLTGVGAVRVKRRYVIPELFGWYTYRFCADGVLLATRYGPLARRLAIYVFVAMLLSMIFVGIPFVLLGMLIVYPLLYRSIERYAVRLAEPSGEAGNVAK
nr:hypothetical protein [uncultured bacterium]